MLLLRLLAGAAAAALADQQPQGRPRRSRQPSRSSHSHSHSHRHPPPGLHQTPSCGGAPPSPRHPAAGAVGRGPVRTVLRCAAHCTACCCKSLDIPICDAIIIRTVPPAAAHVVVFVAGRDAHDAVAPLGHRLGQSVHHIAQPPCVTHKQTMRACIEARTGIARVPACLPAAREGR